MLPMEPQSAFNGSQEILLYRVVVSLRSSPDLFFRSSWAFDTQDPAGSSGTVTVTPVSERACARTPVQSYASTCMTTTIAHSGVSIGCSMVNGVDSDAKVDIIRNINVIEVRGVIGRNLSH